MALTIVTSDRFALHQTPPGHMECPERSDVMSVVAADWRARGADVIEPEPASMEALTRVHQADYLCGLEATSGRAIMIDDDTFTSPETWDVARLAAGAAIDAVRAVLDGRAVRAAALVRPPGHHAEPARAMGFCFVNNVAVAAAEARASGVERVAVVDFDVHHGNGTQMAFLADPSVLFISTHQSPCYPGTGHQSEVGVRGGEGFTVNIPMDAGCTDADYDEVFERIVVPVVSEINPGLVLVSAGFDAHERDLIGGMRMTADGYATLCRHLVGLADRCAGGRLVLVTEGGYHLPSLRASLDASLQALASPTSAGDQPAARPAGSRVRGDAAARRTRAAQSRYWRGL
jgi:acetoin utilization deacetylase AcuC-like enzyme